MMIVGLLACLLASALLFDPRNAFSVDWNNHLWAIEYFGESIKHLKIPDMLNTQQLVGMPVCLFYAQKFYALLGMFSMVLGSAITIRIMAFMVLLLQFVHVYRAAKKTGSTQNIAIAIAVIVTWAIYPLTNLYNRSALTEFFAVAFLTCSVASFLCVVINAKKDVVRYDYIATGLFFTAAAVTHPLTAVFGGLFLGVLVLIALVYCENEKKLWLLKCFLITVFFSFLVLSPWIYILYKFDDKLTVFAHATNTRFFHDTYFFPKSIDNIFSRLAPFPLDLRSLQKGVQDVPVPYLDAQITLPLVLLIAALMYMGWREKRIKSSLNPCERAMVGGSAIMLVMFLVESVCPKTFDWMGDFFSRLQFPYRLTTYVNLCALVIIIILAGRMSIANAINKQIINVCLACCLAISLVAVIQKLVHVAAITEKSTKVSKEFWAPLPFGSNNHLNELPLTDYGVGAYDVKEGFEKGIVSGTYPLAVLSFHVLDGVRFGQVEGMTVKLSEPRIVVTNVQPFPWNQIRVNGSTDPRYGIIDIQGRGSILLPQGTYLLDFVTSVDSIWKNLNILSWVLLIGWVVLYMGICFSKESWCDDKN